MLPFASLLNRTGMNVIMGWVLMRFHINHSQLVQHITNKTSTSGLKRPVWCGHVLGHSSTPRCSDTTNLSRVAWGIWLKALGHAQKVLGEVRDEEIGLRPHLLVTMNLSFLPYCIFGHSTVDLLQWSLKFYVHLFRSFIF